MATTPVAPACPIRLVSFRLAAKGSTEVRRPPLPGKMTPHQLDQFDHPGA
jgi:hypothetical protein